VFAEISTELVPPFVVAGNAEITKLQLLSLRIHLPEVNPTNRMDVPLSACTNEGKCL
jgi:hypothetical protein